MNDQTLITTSDQDIATAKSEMQKGAFHMMASGFHWRSAKEKFTEEHGSDYGWKERVEQEGISLRSVENLMNAFEVFGGSTNIDLVGLSATVLGLLAAPSVSDETRTEVLARAQAQGGISVREVKETIKQSKETSAEVTYTEEALLLARQEGAESGKQEGYKEGRTAGMQEQFEKDKKVLDNVRQQLVDASAREAQLNGQIEDKETLIAKYQEQEHLNAGEQEKYDELIAERDSFQDEAKRIQQEVLELRRKLRAQNTADETVEKLNALRFSWAAATRGVLAVLTEFLSNRPLAADMEHFGEDDWRRLDDIEQVFIEALGVVQEYKRARAVISEDTIVVEALQS